MRYLTCALLTTALVPAFSTAAPPKGLEAYLPDDVVGYVRLNDLGAHIQTLLDSDFRRRAESLPLVQLAMSQEPWRGLQEQAESFRNSTGKRPQDVLPDLLGREVVLGLRLGFGGPEIILLSRAASPAKLEEALQTVRKAVEKRAGYPIEGIRTQRGEHSVESIGAASFACVGEILVASNSLESIDKVFDLHDGRSKSSVGASDAFRKAASRLPEDALATLVVRPRFIPSYYISAQADNPVTSLVFGGWLGALEASEWITGSVVAKGKQLELALSSLVDSEKGDESRWKKYRAFFPEAAPDRLLDRLEGKGLLGAVQIHRDLLAWWQNRQALLRFPEQSGLIQFESVLSTLFGGRDLEREILPGLGKRVTIVARTQAYEDLSQKPVPELPGFAAILELEKPAEMRDRIALAFQTITSFINADRAQKGQQAGRLSVEKVGNVNLQLLSLPADDDGKSILRNFSPALGVVGSHLVLSSSAELGKMLVKELQSPVGNSSRDSVATQDSLLLDVAALGSILSANKGLLISDSMSKKGNSREQASAEVDGLLDILRLFRDVRLSSGRDGDAITLRLQVRTATEEGNAVTRS